MEKIQLSNRQVNAVIKDAMGEAAAELLPLDGGDWSAAFSFAAGSREYVVRFSRLDEDFHRDAFAYRFASPQIPIPPVLEIGEFSDGFYAISEKAPGITLNQLDSRGMGQITPAILDLLDALRRTDVSGTSGFGGWDANGKGTSESWKESLLAINIDDPDGRISGWREKLAGSRYGTGDFDRIYTQFSRLLEVCPEPRHLVHSDLLHHNLLVNRGKISAVIDWGCARYGDFLYELAWFTFWAPWIGAMEGIDWRALALQYYAEHGIVVQHFDQRLTAYELHIGLDSVVYCAYIERWGMVGDVLEQMEQILSNQVENS
jgi:hygromycin-B 4-O-kinase